MNTILKSLAAVLGSTLLAAGAHAEHPDPSKRVPSASSAQERRLAEPKVHPGGRHDVVSHQTALRAQAERDRRAARTR